LFAGIVGCSTKSAPGRQVVGVVESRVDGLPGDASMRRMPAAALPRW
jgi:hypothetical protein